MKNLLCAALCFLTTLTFAAEKPQKVKLAAVPPAVRQAIREQLPKGRPDDIQRTVEEGRVIYEVNITRDGVERYFSVSEEGKLLTLQVRLEEAPAPVQQVIKDQLGADQVGQVNRTEDHGDFIYEVELKRGSGTRALTVSSAGKLLTIQVELSETPDIVQRVIKVHTGEHKLGKITRNEVETEVVYEVALIKGTKELTFTVATGGRLVSEQIELTDAPGEVQQAVKARLGGGALLWLERADEEGEVTFNLGTRKGDVERSFGFNATGDLLSEQVLLSETPEVVRKTIEQENMGGVLVRIEKATDDGETFYEVETRKAGKKLSFKVSAEGRVVVE